MCRDHRLHEHLCESPEKALDVSRRLIQSAKRRARRPLDAEIFFQSTDPRRGATYPKMTFPFSPDKGITYSLPETPRKLMKPTDIEEVDVDKVYSLEPELKDTPIEYIRRALVGMSNKFLGAFQHFVAEYPRPAAPDFANIIMKDSGLITLPTHMLAVYGDNCPDLSPPVVPGRAITLYPVHALVLLSYCARLPDFPRTPAQMRPITLLDPEGEYITAYRLPVVRLRVPRTDSFGALLRYMYSRDQDELLSDLLGISPSPTPEHLPYTKAYIADSLFVKSHLVQCVAERCAQAFQHNLCGVCGCALRIEGLWNNAVALRISDNSLWDAIGLAWDAVMIAARIVEERLQAATLPVPRG